MINGKCPKKLVMVNMVNKESVEIDTDFLICKEGFLPVKYS